MKWDIYGPLIFWSLMFLVGASVQYVAFDQNGIIFSLPIDLSLWATGILFSICVSKQAISDAKLIPKYKKHEDGQGFSINYDVTLPENIDSTPKLTYFFLFGIAIWIISILLSGISKEALEAGASATANLNYLKIYSALSLSYFLSFFSVGLALNTLGEVVK